MSHDRGADDPARKQRQCVGKRGLISESEARDHARAMHKKFKAKFSAYECPWCGLWHTGTDRTPRQAQRRAAAAGVSWHGGVSE